MAVTCINKSDGEYQSKLKMAGIPQTTFDFWYQYFLNKYDRPPELDELPGTNSEEHLFSTLNVKRTKTLNSAKTEDILALTGKETIEEASATLNNVYKDLEITLVNAGDITLINVKHRPTYFSDRTVDYKNNFEPNQVNNKIVLINMLNKMRNAYGINISLITTEDINSSEELSNIPGVKSAKAFVFNNNIYLNTDYANIDSSVHELLHIFLGGMRYTNPAQYMNLISKMNNSAVNMQQYEMLYPNRTQNDLMEEVFVSEVSKFLCGFTSAIDNFSESDIDLLIYNITRNLDTALMGAKSVRKLDNTLFRTSLLQLAQKTQSESINKADVTPMDLAYIHRKVANVKSKLLESDSIVQNCE